MSAARECVECGHRGPVIMRGVPVCDACGAELPASAHPVATCSADVEGIVCPSCGGPTIPDIDMGGGTEAEWFAWCEPCAAGWFLADLV